MSNKVFANGREISCKAAAGKSIAAFPDVCLSPPTPPAGPIPIPYPNTAMSSDASGGSKTVKISGKEVMLKNKSYFKKSTGNEAATKSQGMGVITHQIQGKAYFMSWSMDVKIEGANAVRHLDMTTHNHGSGPNTPPWPYLDTAAVLADSDHPCHDSVKKEQAACGGDNAPKQKKTAAGSLVGLDCTDDCATARACALPKKKDDKKVCCSPNTTGHHLVEVHCLTPTGGRAEGLRLPGVENYDDEAAPCACVNRSRSSGPHGVCHYGQQTLEAAYSQARGEAPLATFPGAGKTNKKTGARDPGVSHWTYAEARDAGVASHKAAAPHCDEGCTRAQLDAYHKDHKDGPKLKDNTPLRSDPDAATQSRGVPSQQQIDTINKELDKVTGMKPASPQGFA